MYVFTEKGDLMEDRSFLENIPSSMSHTSYTLSGNNVWTLGAVKEQYMKRRLEVYAGGKWREKK